jgi:F-type H+-transporting ATPase subunit O
MEVLAENKRLNFIKEVAQKYKRYYAAFNKEEKITIISAASLSTAQESQVLEAL